MPEIGTSGLMSGEGKRVASGYTAPFLDSTSVLSHGEPAMRTHSPRRPISPAVQNIPAKPDYVSADGITQTAKRPSGRACVPEAPSTVYPNSFVAMQGELFE